MSTFENERDEERRMERERAEIPELEQLQSAWDSVAPPELDGVLQAEDLDTQAAVAWMRGTYANVLPSQELQEETDDATANSVAWMQQTYRQVQAPTTPAINLMAKRSEPPTRPETNPRNLRLLPALVASLAAAGLVAYILTPGATRPANPRSPLTNETSVEVALGPDTTPPDSPESIPAQPPVAPQQNFEVTTDIVDGRIEMRSGPVRLQLFAAVKPQPEVESPATPEISGAPSALPNPDSRR